MNVKVHDFRKPAPLPLAWRERLQKWSRTAVAQANKAWAKQLPIALEVKAGDWEGTYAAQALAAIKDPCIAYRVTIAAGRVSTLLVLPRDLMFSLVATLLGESDHGSSGRDLTIVEEGIADYFLTEYWLSAFREAWPGGAASSWVLDGRESPGGRNRCFAAGEGIQIFRWEIGGPWGDAGGVWLFPEKALLAALDGKDPASPAAAAPGPTAARRASLVQALPVTMQVILGSTEVKLSQLRSLQVGDVLLLDPNGQAVARVGSQELYRGRVGRRGSTKAFQIKSLPESNP